MPKAAIVLNLYGQITKMDELIEVCSRYQVPILEDAAESDLFINERKAVL